MPTSRSPLWLVLLAAPLAAQAPQRPMTFLDVQEMRQATAPVVSADGQWALYTISTPDWKQARRQSDIYLVGMRAGLPSTRQLTFTKDKDELSPRWASDGGFVFASNRDAVAAAGAAAAPAAGGRGGGGGPASASGNQLYYMRTDGGEARKITDAAGGVAQFQFTRDGKWLVYTAGRAEAQQLWALPAATLDGTPVQLTKHPTPVGQWQLSKDGTKAFFLAPDTMLTDERRRTEAHFGVMIRNAPEPRVHLWELDLATRATRRLTGDAAYSVTTVTLSDDGRWAGFNATRDDRYYRGTTDERDASDLYLLELATGKVERLTDNVDIGESALSFSPDSRTIAYSAEDDFKLMRNRKLYVRPVEGGAWRKLGAGWDADLSVGWWSADARTIYFNEGWRATNQLFAVDVATGKVSPLTDLKASVNVTRDERSGALLIAYTDPTTPPSTYTVASLAQVGDRSAWVRLTQPNPQADHFALGEETETCWKSTDGAPACGVLLKPVGYQQGTRYPLIVAIHGGPAAADLLSFNGGYGAQIYAGAGYAVLMPNYRNSTNYGEKFKTESQGDYFTKGYQDIMTGVDQLIKDGLVDGDHMGALGWSAGGHWSNWILTHTNRFKAISTGAGTMNWLSMYAESDVQRVRQWYMGDKLPYDDFDHWFAQSPIKYIRNAKTPTMIHVVQGDPRVPRPQSEELHMALKKLGVPTEFYVYPGNTHGIPAARDQFTKSMAEFAWMEKWVRGKPVTFEWKELLKTLDAPPAPKM
ncbi:MAG: S9 family peptidase [Gemmatimonadetes bacterium]|nr:S9 family peptidase [Gemmatimonadota bacterium]